MKCGKSPLIIETHIPQPLSPRGWQNKIVHIHKRYKSFLRSVIEILTSVSLWPYFLNLLLPCIHVLIPLWISQRIKQRHWSSVSSSVLPLLYFLWVNSERIDSSFFSKFLPIQILCPPCFYHLGLDSQNSQSLLAFAPFATQWCIITWSSKQSL